VGGCYADMLNTFPAGTVAVMRIMTMIRSFEADSTVVYSIQTWAWA
jgi:hypothetical protein